MDAMAQGDFKAAKVSFEKELARMPYDDELHFLLAQAHLHLGEVNDARRQVSLAWENSTTRDRRGIYAAKMEHLRRCNRPIEAAPATFRPNG